MTLTLGAKPKERGEGRRRTREPKAPSDGDMRELRTAFGLLDRNRDGRVFAEDISHMMHSLGYDLEQESIKTFIRTAANGGQCIREHEFISWMEKIQRTQTNNSILKDAFTAIDRDQDGYITKGELRHSLELIGENISDKALDLMVKEADVDNDGKLSYKDFSYIMQL